jgi:hypothetical protein
MALAKLNYFSQSQNSICIPIPCLAWSNAEDIGDVAAEVPGKLLIRISHHHIQ